MKDCEICVNHEICRLEHKDKVEKCAFVNPTEEIPIIHGKAELEEHDKRVRDKAIQKFVTEAMKQFTEFDLKHGYPTVVDCKNILREVAELMKGE